MITPHDRDILKRLPEWNATGVPTDLVMRNSGTGGLEIYDIGNNALLGAASMGAVGLDWKTPDSAGSAAAPAKATC